MELVVLFGSRTRHFRVQKGITQEQLADLTDMHTETISRLERGKMQPSITVMVAVARALGCGIVELVEQRPSMDEGWPNHEEQALLQIWRSIEPEARSRLLSFLQIL